MGRQLTSDSRLFATASVLGRCARQLTPVASFLLLVIGTWLLVEDEPEEPCDKPLIVWPDGEPDF
jgi:hypothetical protein